MLAAKLRDHPALRALTVPNFGRYFVGDLVSMTGGFVQSISLVWLILELGGNAFDIALMLSIQNFPSLVLAPVGRHLPDVVLVVQQHRAIVAGPPGDAEHRLGRPGVVRLAIDEHRGNRGRQVRLAAGGEVLRPEVVALPEQQESAAGARLQVAVLVERPVPARDGHVGRAVERPDPA